MGTNALRGHPLVKRPQNCNVYHRPDGAALLIASDDYRYQQTVVHVIDQL